jgi:hypothetical protein
MLEVSVALVAQGKTFSPRKAGAELGIDLSGTGEEPGSICMTGKFKGRPIPFGSTILHLPLTPEIEQSNELDAMADLLPPNLILFRRAEIVPTLRRHGATEIRLQVVVAYREQCNMEMSSTLIAALAGLGVPVVISCFDAEEDDG